MLKIKAPHEYYCENGILSEAGNIISRFGQRAYIIAGRTAWAAVADKLITSLNKRFISFSLSITEGYPTYDAVVTLTGNAYKENADVIIGIGGGKVCDIAKAVANARNIPVVMIPSVAATCACWAARSILYDTQGSFDRALWNENNPDVIIADTGILRAAPKRYLAAGILDTLAKWYEFEPLISSDPGDIVLKQDVAIAKLAFDILMSYGEKAYSGEADEEEFRQTLDAIFFLAGASGSFANGKAYRGFAHSYYYASTRIAASRHRLHGEKVAFGLLVQQILLDKPEKDIEELIGILRTYDMTDTPYDWKSEDPDSEIDRISDLILRESPVVIEKGFVSDTAECADAIRRASELLKRTRGE